MKIDLSVYNNKNINFKLIPLIFYSYELGKPYKNRNVELEAFKDVISVDSRKIERNNMDLGIGMEYNYRDELTFDNDSIKVGFKINF